MANKTCNALFSKMITAMDMIGDLCPNVSLHTTVMIGLLLVELIAGLVL